MQNLGRYLAATKDDNLTCKHSGPSALCCFFSLGASTTCTWAGRLSSERRGLPLALRRPPDHRLGLPGPPLWLGSPQLPAPGRGPTRAAQARCSVQLSGPSRPSGLPRLQGPVSGAITFKKGQATKDGKDDVFALERSCMQVQLQEANGRPVCLRIRVWTCWSVRTDQETFQLEGERLMEKVHLLHTFDQMLDAGHPWEDAGHRLHPGRQQLL